jgi:hypothetical protein
VTEVGKESVGLVSPFPVAVGKRHCNNDQATMRLSSLQQEGACANLSSITHGGSMSQTLQRPTNQIPAWLVFTGVVIGIVGATVTKHAENVGELVGAFGGRTATSASATTSPADWGLGLLVVGASVLLAGLIVIAVRRPT